MTKNTSITEGHTLQFRFEAFNFVNHPNCNPPASNIRSPATFGRAVSARTMRELQFGLKYIYRRSGFSALVREPGPNVSELRRRLHPAACFFFQDY